MRVPEDRTDRLDETIYSQLRTLADAEQAGADVAPIAETLLGTLSPLSPFQIEALERAYRSARYSALNNWPNEPWTRGRGLVAFLDRIFETRPRSRAAPPRTPKPALRWLKILDSSGFVREEMLNAIDGPPPSPILLAALLHSLNDHVPQVRAAANECFPRIGGTIATDVIVAAVPYLVRRPREWRHAQNSSVVQALLSLHDIRAGVRETLLTGKDGWLPRFFRDLLATDLADIWLEEIASKAAHPAIRARSILILTEGKVDGLVAYEGRWRDATWNRTRVVEVTVDIPALIATGARDRTVLVRKAAAQGLARHYKKRSRCATAARRLW
jgi:hypothetical protein